MFGFLSGVSVSFSFQSSEILPLPWSCFVKKGQGRVLVEKRVRVSRSFIAELTSNRSDFSDVMLLKSLTMGLSCCEKN